MVNITTLQSIVIKEGIDKLNHPETHTIETRSMKKSITTRLSVKKEDQVVQCPKVTAKEREKMKPKEVLEKVACTRPVGKNIFIKTYSGKKLSAVPKVHVEISKSVNKAIKTRRRQLDTETVKTLENIKNTPNIDDIPTQSNIENVEPTAKPPTRTNEKVNKFPRTVKTRSYGNGKPAKIEEEMVEVPKMVNTKSRESPKTPEKVANRNVKNSSEYFEPENVKKRIIEAPKIMNTRSRQSPIKPVKSPPNTTTNLFAKNSPRFEPVEVMKDIIETPKMLSTPVKRRLKLKSSETSEYFEPEAVKIVDTRTRRSPSKHVASVETPENITNLTVKNTSKNVEPKMEINKASKVVNTRSRQSPVNHVETPENATNHLGKCNYEYLISVKVEKEIIETPNIVNTRTRHSPPVKHVAVKTPENTTELTVGNKTEQYESEKVEKEIIKDSTITEIRSKQSPVKQVLTVITPENTINPTIKNEGEFESVEVDENIFEVPEIINSRPGHSPRKRVVTVETPDNAKNLIVKIKITNDYFKPVKIENKIVEIPKIVNTRLSSPIKEISPENIENVKMKSKFRQSSMTNFVKVKSPKKTGSDNKVPEKSKKEIIEVQKTVTSTLRQSPNKNKVGVKSSVPTVKIPVVEVTETAITDTINKGENLEPLNIEIPETINTLVPRSLVKRGVKVKSPESGDGTSEYFDPEAPKIVNTKTRQSSIQYVTEKAPEITTNLIMENKRESLEPVEVEKQIIEAPKIINTRTKQSSIKHVTEKKTEMTTNLIMENNRDSLEPMEVEKEIIEAPKIVNTRLRQSPVTDKSAEITTNLTVKNKSDHFESVAVIEAPKSINTRTRQSSIEHVTVKSPENNTTVETVEHVKMTEEIIDYPINTVNTIINMPVKIKNEIINIPKTKKRRKRKLVIRNEEISESAEISEINSKVPKLDQKKTDSTIEIETEHVDSPQTTNTLVQSNNRRRSLRVPKKSPRILETLVVEMENTGKRKALIKKECKTGKLKKPRMDDAINTRPYERAPSIEGVNAVSENVENIEGPSTMNENEHLEIQMKQDMVIDKVDNIVSEDFSGPYEFEDWKVVTFQPPQEIFDISMLNEIKSTMEYNVDDTSEVQYCFQNIEFVSVNSLESESGMQNDELKNDDPILIQFESEKIDDAAESQCNTENIKSKIDDAAGTECDIQNVKSKTDYIVETQSSNENVESINDTMVKQSIIPNVESRIGETKSDVQNVESQLDNVETQLSIQNVVSEVVDTVKILSDVQNVESKIQSRIQTDATEAQSSIQNVESKIEDSVEIQSGVQNVQVLKKTVKTEKVRRSTRARFTTTSVFIDTPKKSKTIKLNLTNEDEKECSQILQKVIEEAAIKNMEPIQARKVTNVLKDDKMGNKQFSKKNGKLCESNESQNACKTDILSTIQIIESGTDNAIEIQSSMENVESTIGDSMETQSASISNVAKSAIDAAIEIQTAIENVESTIGDSMKIQPSIPNDKLTIDENVETQTTMQNVESNIDETMESQLTDQNVESNTMETQSTNENLESKIDTTMDTQSSDYNMDSVNSMEKKVCKVGKSRKIPFSQPHKSRCKQSRNRKVCDTGHSQNIKNNNNDLLQTECTSKGEESAASTLSTGISESEYEEFTSKLLEKVIETVTKTGKNKSSMERVTGSDSNEECSSKKISETRNLEEPSAGKLIVMRISEESSERNICEARNLGESSVGEVTETKNLEESSVGIVTEIKDMGQSSVGEVTETGRLESSVIKVTEIKNFEESNVAKVPEIRNLCFLEESSASEVTEPSSLEESSVVKVIEIKNLEESSVAKVTEIKNLVESIVAEIKNFEDSSVSEVTETINLEESSVGKATKINTLEESSMGTVTGTRNLKESCVGKVTETINYVEKVTEISNHEESSELEIVNKKRIENSEHSLIPEKIVISQVDETTQTDFTFDTCYKKGKNYNFHKRKSRSRELCSKSENRKIAMKSLHKRKTEKRHNRRSEHSISPKASDNLKNVSPRLKETVKSQWTIRKNDEVSPTSINISLKQNVIKYCEKMDPPDNPGKIRKALSPRKPTFEEQLNTERIKKASHAKLHSSEGIEKTSVRKPIIKTRSHTKLESPKIIEEIIGASVYRPIPGNPGQLMFLVKWLGHTEPTVVPAVVANVKWPQVVIKFYERLVVFTNK